MSFFSFVPTVCFPPAPPFSPLTRILHQAHLIPHACVSVLLDLFTPLPLVPSFSLSTSSPHAIFIPSFCLFPPLLCPIYTLIHLMENYRGLKNTEHLLIDWWVSEAYLKPCDHTVTLKQWKKIHKFIVTDDEMSRKGAALSQEVDCSQALSIVSLSFPFLFITVIINIIFSSLYQSYFLCSLFIQVFYINIFLFPFHIFFVISFSLYLM